MLGQGAVVLGAVLPWFKVWDAAAQVERIPPPEQVQVILLFNMQLPLTAVSVTEEGVPEDLQLLHPVS